jgi:hypothetical protein
MQEKSYKSSKKENTNTDLDIDLSDVKSLRSQDIIEQRDPRRGLLRELHAGTVAKVVVIPFASILLLPLVGGLVAAFGSVAQAQAFTTTALTVMEALAKFIPQVLWPALTVVLGYYFIRERKDK